MRICIIYDTKRGSTTFFANWLRETFQEAGISADVKKAAELENFDYDLFIVGSPIYYEKPLKSIVNFLSANEEILQTKKLAVFVVCMAQLFGKTTKKYIKNRYLKSLEKKVSGTLLGKIAFRGWLKKPNYNEKKNVENWAKYLIDAL